ncbi:protein indeterminate-domain 12-like [Gastrolobium bilobum]|uniref:protein indeterminate-domain 12-like n=1 Tax=Gastrolobium bilobum TaxID=150636 RepID=UPI002AB094F9|nr:protein indeterminate-domain 12-like [Gastrolobium bilobum]XP_061367823.1 protein indeterminate-domain 12-like [Gastrolobium bilobum]XP_061367824.1 protein indeterminate-domain 12-like [Gastrolobium bilobum]
MMKGLVVDENMSNLTSASSEISASSGTRNDNGSLHPQYSSTSTNQEPQPKKKRSLPGYPDPEAEVIALTPKTLMTTNRFICEVCNKGFQRDQNLQLHKRGHNLPWKLKKKNSKEITRKKVYICPEPTCVHHDPSRALGDLTGIKKHFFRKHGEKKWKCDKCSKRYAVQSDWKAHSKICGTREYKCDCGTLFSRRDSFITHRAFCDALAQESARTITAMNPLLSTHTQLHSHGFQPPSSVKIEQGFNLRPEIPPFHQMHFDQCLIQHENPNPTTTLFPSFHSNVSPHMSATALLQKASQIGVTVTAPSHGMLRPHHLKQQVHVHEYFNTTGYNMASSSAVSGMVMPSREEIGTGFGHGLASYGNKAATTSDYLEECDAANTEADQEYSLFNDVMASTMHSASGFEEAMTMKGMFNSPRGNELVSKSTLSPAAGANDEMTRDFLSLKAFSQREFFNISEIDHLGSSYGKQNHNQGPWQG